MFLKKTLHNPAKKPSSLSLLVPQSVELHTAISTLPFAFVRSRDRARGRSPENRAPVDQLSGSRAVGARFSPFGAECGKTSNLQLYRVSTFPRDGPGKKSRTNSHRLAEWPQSVCLTSWCIDLCATMQRARVFSSLLYQDVMVFDVPEKDPCKKPSPHKAQRGTKFS